MVTTGNIIHFSSEIWRKESESVSGRARAGVGANILPYSFLALDELHAMVAVGTSEVGQSHLSPSANMCRRSILMELNSSVLNCESEAGQKLRSRKAEAQFARGRHHGG